MGWEGGLGKEGEDKDTEEERKKRKSDLVAASFEAELNWQEQLIFTWGRLTELKENNKGTEVGVSLFFCLTLPFEICFLLEKLANLRLSPSLMLDFLSDTQTLSSCHCTWRFNTESKLCYHIRQLGLPCCKSSF